MHDVYEPIVLDFATHYEKAPLILENLTCYAMAPGQTAVTIRWPASPSIAQCGAILRNLTFKPGTHEWANGIDLTNGWNVVIDAVNGYSGPTGMFQNGVILRGQCMDVKMSRLHLVHPVTGVLVLDESEGPTIHDARVLGAIYGVVANTPEGEAGLTVSDSHFAVSRAGIVAVNRPQASYHDVLIYRHEWRAGPAFDGIYVGPGSHDTDIHDVKVKGFGHPVTPVSIWQAENVRIRDVREI